jgi:hypothetical protein
VTVSSRVLTDRVMRQSGSSPVEVVAMDAVEIDQSWESVGKMSRLVKG